MSLMTTMITTRIVFMLLSLSHAIASPRFNLSHFIYPKISDEFRPQPSLFLKDILGAISASEHWKLEDFRVSRLEIEKAKFGNLQRYEIEFLFGNKKDFIFTSWDEVSSWKKFKDIEADFEIIANQVSSKAILDSIQIEGPVELLVAEDDEMSLILPGNTSHAGLKRILVGEDITVEVKNAHQVSVLQTSNRQQTEENLISHIFPFLTCLPLLPVKISGSASVSAYRTQNPNAHITSNLLSPNLIELLPDQCYPTHTYKNQQCPIKSLRSRIRLLEKVLKSFLTGTNNGVKLKAKIEASTAFRFVLEIERKIRVNDSRWTTMAEWRTKPSVEHVLFDVMARIEKGRLKPLVVNKMKPFVGVDSSAWSNFMANMSFTKLSSGFVAPEALTLDVNW